MASTLQADHAQATRHRIVMACAQLMADESPATLSIPAVAERARVSVRTVYRYFPTKEDLVIAAGEQSTEPARQLLGGKVDFDSFRQHLPNAWRVLKENRALLLAAQRTPEGVAGRHDRAVNRRKEVIAALQEIGIDLDAERQRKVADLIGLVTGSVALFEVTETLDHDVDEGAAMAVFAVDAIIEHVRRTKGEGL